MDKRRWADDDQFAGPMFLFGASLLRRARKKANQLSPAAAGEHPDTPLATATSDGIEEVLAVLEKLSENTHAEALLLMMHGMIMEHLRLSTTTPRTSQRH